MKTFAKYAYTLILKRNITFFAGKAYLRIAFALQFV